MKLQAAHTPTPWKVMGNCDEGFKIRDAEGECIADLLWEGTPEDEANAAYIVRAVNAHEELIKRSKELIMRFNNLENLYFKETGYTRGEGLAGEVIRMNEAITKAEGK